MAGFAVQRAKTASFYSGGQLLLRNVGFKSCQTGDKCGVLLATVQQMVRDLKGNISTKVDALHKMI